MITKICFWTTFEVRNIGNAVTQFYICSVLPHYTTMPAIAMAASFWVFYPSDCGE